MFGYQKKFAAFDIQAARLLYGNKQDKRGYFYEATK